MGMRLGPVAALSDSRLVESTLVPPCMFTKKEVFLATWISQTKPRVAVMDFFIWWRGVIGVSA